MGMLLGLGFIGIILFAIHRVIHVLFFAKYADYFPLGGGRGGRRRK